jgi:ceramide glucosyltransferase
MTGSAGDELGKMHNLLGGLAEASGQRLVFIDSDVRLPHPRYLDRFLAGLDQPGVGLVTCYPAYQDAGGVPAAVITLTINDDLLGMFAAVAALGPLSVANGSCLALDRNVLDRAGGLTPLRHQLLMDSALARRVLSTSGDVWLHEEGAPVRVGHATWAQVRQQSRRWHLAMSRVLSPPIYLGFAWVRSGFLLGSLAFAATTFDPVVGSALAGYLAVRIAVSWWLDRRFLASGTLGRYLWLLPVIEWINGWDALTAPLERVVRWRGRIYRVDRRGRATQVTARRRPTGKAGR